MSDITKNSHAGIFLGLGTNLGNREKNLQRALQIIKNHETIRLVKTSGFYRSKPWGVASQPWFLNAVCEIATQLSPGKLLKELKEMEKVLGRKPKGKKWSPREIDLDILIYRNIVMETPELIIPHQYLKDRLFALIPLLEIAPETTHPTTGKRLEIYCQELKDKEPAESCLPYKPRV